MKLFADLEMFHEVNILICSLKRLFYAVCIPSFRSNHPVPRQVLKDLRFLQRFLTSGVKHVTRCMLLKQWCNVTWFLAAYCYSSSGQASDSSRSQGDQTLQTRFKNYSVMQIVPWSYKKSICLTIFIHSWFRIIFRSISNNEFSIAASTFLAPYLDFKSLYCRNNPALT